MQPTAGLQLRPQERGVRDDQAKVTRAGFPRRVARDGLPLDAPQFMQIQGERFAGDIAVDGQSRRARGCIPDAEEAVQRLVLVP
jgi:hypothetical protein